MLCIKFTFCILTEVIYFTNDYSSKTYLEMAHMKSQLRLVLLKTENDQPRAVAVNPIKRLYSIIILIFFMVVI